MSTLIKKVIQDINTDPEKIDRYIRMLADSGMIRGLKVIKLSKVSTDTLQSLTNNGTIVIIK